MIDNRYDLITQNMEGRYAGRTCGMTETCGDGLVNFAQDPEATAEMIDPEGWLHMGDLARKDEQGYYYMVGRKKDRIILDSGENVSPEELEKLLGRGEALPRNAAGKLERK